MSTYAEGLASQPTSGWDGLTIYEGPRRLTRPGRPRGNVPDGAAARSARSQWPRTRAHRATGSVYPRLSLQRPRAERRPRWAPPPPGLGATGNARGP